MRITHTDPDISVDPANQSGGLAGMDVSDLIGIVRRGWLFALLGVLVGLAAAVAFVVSVPELYKSSARILIDRSVNRYLVANKLADEPVIDDTETGGQIYIISSESIVIPVVRSMNLTHDSEFVGLPKTPGEQRAWGVGDLIVGIKMAVGLTDETTLEPDIALERTAVETLLKRLTVNREDVPNVINLTFASRDPQKAANIANALADTYVASALEKKTKSTKMASQLLQERLSELKSQAADADRALQEYKAANNFVDAGKGPLSSEQSLNSHLTSARIAMAEAKARIERFERPNGEGVASATAPDNEVILRLRSQYLELAARVTEIEERVGKEHIAAVKIRKRMEDLRSAIKDEQQRIAGSYASEFQLAKARYDELVATMAQIMGDRGTTGRAQSTIHELESSAETLRNSYNSVLQKVSEINQIEAQPASVGDVRIITRAAPSLQKSFKKGLAVLGGGTVLGLLLGMAAAVAKEFPFGVFRTPEQVVRTTGIYCAVLPSIEERGRKKSLNMNEYILDAPYSRFAETLRNVSSLISAARREESSKVICVFSSVPREGKTTVATNLASLLSVHSKLRTLLIDCDLHKRTLTTRMVPDATVGLLEALTNPSQLSALVSKIERSGLHVLPCALSARVPNAAELLGSPQMERLLNVARETYDVVILEVAPIMAVVDFKVLERFIDRFVFVIEWGKTRRRLAQEALLEAGWSNRDRIVCILLNKADPAALRAIESYKGPRFESYYQNDNLA